MEVRRGAHVVGDFNHILKSRVNATALRRNAKRHGTTTLFAALNVLDGKVIGQCQQHHTHAEWLTFLKKIDRETPRKKRCI